MGQHFFVRRRLFRFSLQLALDFAKHYKCIRVSLLASAIDFQITQDQRPVAGALKENEWIGRPKFRRVKHVGILLARSDDEACRFSFSFAHCDLYSFPMMWSEQLLITTLLLAVWLSRRRDAPR